MKQKIIGIISILALVLVFYFYGDVLTGCKKKEQSPQPPSVSQPQEPQKPQEPQLPPPTIKETIIFSVLYGKVEFTHKKHAEVLKIICSKCHHNWEKGEVSGDLCKKCHTKQSEITSKDAFHKNCKGCHTQEKKGPAGCKQCHVK